MVNMTETRPRLFVPAPLAIDLPVAGTPAQAHYLGHVLRRGPGDPIRLFDGRNGEFSARIALLKKDRAQFMPHMLLRQQTPEPERLLVFCLLKRDATDLIVQKATELGASAIWPIVSARTNAARANLQRLETIAIEAAEQCERLTVPTIRPPVSLPDLLGAWPEGRPLAAAIERLEAPPPGPPLDALLIGPEGGFAPAELDALRDKPFIRPVSLGRLVLRAETAAIAGLALLATPRH
jgi:16S rRNA (uracil1498-N3)-methyltransferase